jgi:hypothetical protein
MNAYIYQAALYCENCASYIMDRDKDKPGPREDSNDWPQGPYPDGGGEADSPQHCDGCGIFLENPLTKEGEDYVRTTAAQPILAKEVILAQWREFYSYLFNQEETDHVL